MIVLKKFAIIIYGIFTYLVFGALAIIPNDMSFPFIPYQLKSFDSLYYYQEYDKYDVIEEIEHQIADEMVKKKTFENLNLFHNANVHNGIYANLKKKSYNYLYDGDGYKVSMGNDSENITGEYEIYGLPVKIGTDLYLLSSNSVYEGVKGYTVKIGNDITEEFFTGEYTLERVADLLEKQMKDSISKRDFSALVQLTFSKKLCYWNSEEHIAVFSYKDSLIRYNTKEKTSDTFVNRFYKLQTIVSDDELVYYDEPNEKVVLYNFVTNESSDVTTGAENLKGINYQYYEGYLNVILGFDGSVWSLVVKDNEVLSHGTSFSGDILRFGVCGDEIFILYRNENGEDGCYGYGYVVSDRESEKND